MASREVPRHRLRLQRTESRFAVLTPSLVGLVELLHSARSLASDGIGTEFLRATASTRRLDVFFSSLFGRVGRTRSRFISTWYVCRSPLEVPAGRERLESCFDLAALARFVSIVVAAATDSCRARPLPRLRLLPLLLFSGFLRVLVVSRDGRRDGPGGRHEHEERISTWRLFVGGGVGVGVVLLRRRAHAEVLLNVRAHLRILFRTRVPLSVRSRGGVTGGLGDPAGKRRRARDSKHGLERDRDRLSIRRGVASSGEIDRRLLEVDRDTSGEWTSGRRRRSFFGWSHVALSSALRRPCEPLERVGISLLWCSSDCVVCVSVRSRRRGESRRVELRRVRWRSSGDLTCSLAVGTSSAAVTGRLVGLHVVG